jgi:transcriptional regulator with PAS, ATPase and Fis domain
MTATAIAELPKVQQRSIEELIDLNLLHHKRSISEIMDRFQNTVIARALALKSGNISQTAELLQVHRTTLVRWMRQFDLLESEDQP